MSLSAIERLLLCKYRTYPRWGYHGKGIVALDLSVQHSCLYRGNNNHAYLLAAKGEELQKAQHLLAVVPTSGLVRCSPTLGSLYATGLCAPRRWKYGVFVEQYNHRIHLGNFRGMLDRLFRLDILALFWQCPSASGDFSFHYCIYQTHWPSYSVR